MLINIISSYAFDVHIFIDCITTRLSLSPPTISTLSTHVGLSLLPPNTHYLQISNCCKLGNNLCGLMLQHQALLIFFIKTSILLCDPCSHCLAWTAWACARQHTQLWCRGDDKVSWIGCHCASGRSIVSMNTVQCLVCTKIHCGLPRRLQLYRSKPFSFVANVQPGNGIL